MDEVPGRILTRKEADELRGSGGPPMATHHEAFVSLLRQAAGWATPVIDVAVNAERVRLGELKQPAKPPIVARAPRNGVSGPVRDGHPLDPNIYGH
jgi:hypothetical protein